MAELREFEAQLKEPFALDDIDFLPKGKVEREGKTLCMALPYADPRVYQDRLNAIAYGEWSTPAPVVVVAGNKLICYVTVVLCGIPHTDVGEATNNEENTGTEAWAQAFKRACSHFGLGRYLYDLDKEWVPFNPQKKLIDLDKAQKAGIVRKMYKKAGIAVRGRASTPQPAPEMRTSASPKPAAARPEPTQEVDLATTNEAKVRALLKEYKALCPEKCSAKTWYFKTLREAFRIPEGPLPASDAYTAEHVVALSQFVLPYRKQAAQTPV